MVAPFCKLLAPSLCLKTFIELANYLILMRFFQGECVIIHSKDWEADDMAEISARLKSVTPGAASQEFSLAAWPPYGSVVPLQESMKIPIGKLIYQLPKHAYGYPFSVDNKHKICA